MSSIRDIYSGVPSASSPSGTLAFDETNGRGYIHNGTVWQRVGPAVSNSRFVDAVNGNDATAVEGDPSKPYLTLEAALVGAASFDTIYLGPGIHDIAAAISLTTGNVRIVGAGNNNTRIRMSSAVVVADTVMITLGGNTCLQDLHVQMNSNAAGAFNTVGVRITDTALNQPKLINVVVLNLHSYSGATALTAKGIEVRPNNSQLGNVFHIIGSQSYVTAVGANVSATGLDVNTVAGWLRCMTSGFRAAGGLDPVGVHMNIAGGNLELIGCSAEGAGDDTRETAGTLREVATVHANGGRLANVIAGTATLDFGAWPGVGHATVAVSGQNDILATSRVKAWVFPSATADHSADEHILETLKVVAADVVAGTGFTIHGFNASNKNQPNGESPHLTGQWTVAWEWTR